CSGEIGPIRFPIRLRIADEGPGFVAAAGLGVSNPPMPHQVIDPEIGDHPGVHIICCEWHRSLSIPARNPALRMLPTASSADRKGELRCDGQADTRKGPSCGGRSSCRADKCGLPGLTTNE